MNILDRYIFKQFLSSFFFVVLIVVSVICVIDYTEKTDDFIEKHAPARAIIFDYYLNYIPFIANSLSPISIFIATVFITSRLASHTEIVAMQASGMSFARLLRPYLMGSALVAAIVFVLVGWIVPNATKVKHDFEMTYIKSPFSFDERNSHFRVSDSSFIYIESYNNRAQVGYRFCLEQIRGSGLKSRLEAERITWSDSTQKWTLHSYSMQEFGLAPATTPITKGALIDTVFNMTPADFEIQPNLYETFTINELNDFVDKQRRRGVGNVERYLHEKYERFAYPAAIVILTIMGVIVSYRKSRTGSGMQIVLGFFLAFTYVLLTVMSRSIVTAGAVPPIIAAWTPNIVFSFITMGMYYQLVHRQ